METSARVEQFVDAVHYVNSDDWMEKSEEEIEKSLVSAFTRVLKNGTKVFVKDHNTKVVAKPKTDAESKAAIASLGASAKERHAQAKPFKPMKQLLKEASTERLEQLRYRLGGTTHKVLLTKYKGHPLLHWLANVDRELGERAKQGELQHAA
jgi:hypothetical protein